MVSAFLKIHRELEDGLEWEQICERVVDNPEGLQHSYYDREEPRHRLEETIRCELTLDAVFLATFLSGSLFEAEEVHRALMDPMDQERARYLKLGNIVENDGLSNYDTIANDIVKLENQIPLSLIRNVLGILYRDNAAEATSMLNELCRRWIKTFSITLPGFSEKHFQKHFIATDFDFSNECGHLLDCVSRVMRGDGGDSKAEPSSSVPFLDGNDFRGSVLTCLTGSSEYIRVRRNLYCRFLLLPSSILDWILPVEIANGGCSWIALASTTKELCSWIRCIHRTS